MTPISWKLQESYIDLWKLQNPSLLLKINYVALILNEYTQKSWILLLRSKNKFFGMFQLWLIQVESSRDKFNCVGTDRTRDFTCIGLKNFCNKRRIEIGYLIPYIHGENSIAEYY